MSDIKKEQGDINAATDILCELQVETFGSMTRREKTEFILQQVALCIEKGEWTQAGILSRKISKKYFQRRPKKTPEQLAKDQKEREEKEKTRSADDPPILLAKHDDKYLEACKHYRQVLDTEAVEEDPQKLKAVRYKHSQVIDYTDECRRFSNASSTLSSSHHTITSSPISSTASSATHVTR